MKKLLENIKRRIMLCASEACGYSPLERVISESELKNIINQEAEKYSNGWIPLNPDDEDSFPKNNEYILLSFENFKSPCIGRYKQDKNGGAFFIGDDTEACVTLGLIVNAWKKLSERYQSKGE